MAVRCLERENLWWALYHLRHTTDVRILWIDAICINQYDITERNHQVAHMSRIYTNAQQVVIWLGLPHEQNQQIDSIPGQKDDTNGWIQLLQQAHRSHFLQSVGESLNPVSRSAPKTDSISASIKAAAVSRNFTIDTAAGYFVNRSYWTRLWIVQEITLARKVILQCGSSDVPLEFLIEFLKLYDPGNTNESTRETRFIWPRIQQIIKMRLRYLNADDITERGRVRIPPFDIINETSLSQCHDERDMIFALLGLCSQCCTEANMPDYSLDIERVCARLFKHNLEALLQQA